MSGYFNAPLPKEILRDFEANDITLRHEYISFFITRFSVTLRN